MSAPHPPSLPGAEDGRSLLPGWVTWLRRNRHVTVPLAVAPLFAAAGAAASGTHVGTYVGACSVILAGTVWVFAPHKWDRPAEVWFARLSAVVAGGWLTAAAVTGLSWWTAIPLIVLAVAWGIPWWRHKRPREKHATAKLIAEWDAWWQYHAHRWDLAGSSVIDVLLSDVHETLVVQLWAGVQTSRMAQDAAAKIESALKGYVRHGMLRVRHVKHDPSKAHVVLRRENPLGGEIGWDPSLVPSTITEPAPIGRSENGTAILTSLLVNLFIIGRTGSGKSNELSAILATITAVPDARAWLIDRKGGRAARPWMPALDWVATDIEEIRVMLRAADAEVRARALNAYDGNETLRPTSEVPALFLIVDEAAEVTGYSGEEYCSRLLASVTAMGRAVAVHVIVLTQYGALAESVRTEQTRSNLKNRLCFAVAKPEHGAFALSDWDKLDASRLEAEGEFYFQQGPTSPSEPGRGPHMPHDLVRQIAARNGALPRRNLILYASDYQEAYDTRWTRLPDAFVPLAPQAQNAPRKPLPREVETRTVDTPRDTPAGDRAEAVARAQQIEDEIADTPDIPLNPAAASDSAVRARLLQGEARFAATLAMAGDEGVSPKRLVIMSGMSRSWVHDKLRLLIDHAAVIKVGDGAYRQAEGKDVAAELDAIRDGQARLLASAR